MMTKRTANDDESPPDTAGWHLDKKVPISLIFAMLVQVLVVVWTIADIKKDVEVLKSTMVQQSDRDNRQDRAASEAVALVREDIKEVKSMLNRILDRYDRKDVVK